MNKVEFEKVFAETAEKSGVAKMARDYQFAENLQRMMIDLRDKLCPAEQPNKDLKKAAKDFVEKNSPYTDEFMLDNEVEEAYKIAELTFKRGAQWQKEKTINKACEWLNKNVVEYHPRKGELRPIVNINAFREAMEKDDKQCSTE